MKKVVNIALSKVTTNYRKKFFSLKLCRMICPLVVASLALFQACIKITTISNMTIKPFDYQESGITDILDKFQTKQRVLYQLSTGGGKTYIFCFLTKRFIEYSNQKVLILCHRTELIDQTIASMAKIQLTCEAITSKTKVLNHKSNCYVAMIETINNRLKNNPYFLKDVGLVIADECHILIFDKVFEYFPFAKVLGCTATPVVLKRITYFKCKYCKTKYDEVTFCCDEEVMEYSRPFAMSEIYEDIVVGPKITELIEKDRLVKEISFVKDYADTASLKTDATGEFTNKSLEVAYSSDDAVFNVVLNYEELCKGKKTMIFNNSSNVNLIIYKKLLEAGHNVRMFDSVNTKESGNRKELIKWFESERDAVLCNVGVFTTGFDVTDVEAIILNRATNSLALFCQMVGRGARVTNLIYKDSFVLVDGGGNINRHQEFSDPTRDWEKIFWKGIGIDKPKKIDAFDVSTCSECGSIFPKSMNECPECGHVEESKPAKVKGLSEDVLQPISKIPPPNGEKIYKYTVSCGENINFAFKILISQILDLFIYYRVSKEVYFATKANGKLLKRINQLIRPCYFVLLSKQDIKANNNRTISYIVDKVLTKLKERYEF